LTMSYCTRDDPDAQAAGAMDLVLAAELRGDAVHFGLRLRDGDAGVELAEDGESGQVAGEIVVRNLDRAPQLGVAQQERFRRKLKMEIAWQDATMVTSCWL